MQMKLTTGALKGNNNTSSKKGVFLQVVATDHCSLLLLCGSFFFYSFAFCQCPDHCCYHDMVSVAQGVQLLHDQKVSCVKSVEEI